MAATYAALREQHRLPDLREGGSWSFSQRLKNDVLYAAARMSLFAASLLSRSALRALGGFLGNVARHLVRSERQRAIANLERVLPHLAPPARQALLVRSYRELGRQLGDVVATLLGKADLDGDVLEVDADGTTLLRALHAEGRGIVLASAHLGNWERVGAALANVSLPITAVVREAYDPRFDRFLETVRRRAGLTTIARGAKGAAFRLVRTLRKNGVLAIPMDLRSRVASLRVPFMGHPADTAVGPARLALRLGAPVVVATLSEGRVTITQIATSDLTACSEGERELTCRINAELSRRILAAPHLWPWMHPRWPSANEAIAERKTAQMKR